MSNRTIRILIIVALLTVFAAGLAHSASFTYSSQRKEIKAGVLIFPAADGKYTVRSAAPYVFHVLNERPDVKPKGWEFVNPLAPSTVSDDCALRWGLSAGVPISKNMACYWEVRIDSGLTELSQFDILYIGLQASRNLTREQREKLRKVADAGGLLWIENCSTGNIDLNNFVTPALLFRGGSGGWAGAPNRMHPLVHRPYDLSWDELSTLGTDPNELNGSGRHFVGGRRVDCGPGGARYFHTVIGTGSNPAANPILSASQYGSGHIVASAEPIGFAISAFGSSFVNVSTLLYNHATCPGDRISLAPGEDLKAAVNIISWGGEHTTFHKNARHTGYSYDEVTAPLALKWNYDGQRELGITTGSSAAILNDMVFYVDGNGWLHAFDLSPAQDLDGDGNPDDGVSADFRSDFSAGKQYDEIWAQPCRSPASSPTVAYVPVGGGDYAPAVFVATANGELLGFNAVTGADLGNPLVTMNPYPADVAATGVVNVPAPTYFDGVLYAGDGKGFLWAKDLFFGNDWKWPLTPRHLPPSTTSPTVGFFRNPITGSVDQLVYMAARGLPGSINGCVYSFPVKVYNEVLTPDRSTQNRYNVRNYQRVAIKEGAYSVFRVAPGGQLQDITSNATIRQPGAFDIDPGVISPGDTIIADYELDLTRTDYPPEHRQRLEVKTPPPPGSGNPPGVGIVSTPAASSKDILYYGTENGSLYAVMEDGWGITTKWRWYLGDLASVDPGVFPAAPDLATGGVIGSPAVGEDKVYYVVQGGGSSYILAFDADPVFRLNVGSSIDDKRQVEVMQMDTMDAGRPTSFTGAEEGTDTSRRRVTFKVDYGKGRITIENFISPLSASQNIVVRFSPVTESGPGTQVEQVHPAFPGPAGSPYPDDYWNNLAWCLKIPAGAGTGLITSSPMLMGSVLYFGDSEGRVHALDVDRISQTTAKGGYKEAGDVADLHWVWPDPKKGQQGLGGPILSTVAGSQGHIAVTSAEGLAILYNGLTLVADSRRVLEADSAGRVVWSCDSTTTYTGTRIKGTTVPVYGASKKAFNKPSVARRVGTSNILVADTGNNRIVLMDRAGNTLIEISEFKDSGDPPVLPPGSPLKLNTPTDVWMETKVGTGADAGTMSYRFLITDSGNHRIIEVEAKYDQVTGRYSNVELIWATRTLEQGKRYRYTNAGRYPKIGGGTEIIAVIDNYVPDSANPETTGGAIVTINESTGLIDIDPNAGPMVRRYADAIGVKGTYRLVNPTFFTRQFKGDRFTDVIADANGIYVAEFMVDVPPSIAESMKPPYLAIKHVWRAPDPINSSLTITGQRQLAVSNVQLLPNGNLLVTNKASCLDPRAPGYDAQGEVFEIGFDPLSGSWVRGWPAPGSEIGQGSYPLEQPASAERLLQ